VPNPIDISKADCKKIAKKIREDIFKPAYSFKTTIFLCGASLSQKKAIRYKIAQALTNFRDSFYYDLIYPEDIFDELLHSSHYKDLLSLENLLADSVDVIVIIPESPGSFAELGAFASNEKLRNKLICIIDRKFKRDRSFINQGPLKLVRAANKHGIVYIDPNQIGKVKSSYSLLPTDKEVDKIVDSLKKMKKSSSKGKNKITLLQLGNFLLPTIFLLEPVSKITLINIVENAIEDEAYAFHFTTTALTILTKKRQIELTPNGYKLTFLGSSDFLSFRKQNSRVKRQDETVAIDELRLEILNLTNRKKKLKV
jgi:hypothetical protein